jgi:predicted GNAT family acetyltransferase
MSERAAVEVLHNEAAQRFEAKVDGHLSVANYRLDAGVMRMVHTEVPRELEGRGIAAALVKRAIEHARASGLKVAPACSYVRTYMRRHPETQDVLEAGSPLG